LVLLDNARDAEQARELLPGSDGCAAIVTSRDDLSGLVAFNDAYPIRLRPRALFALTEDVRASFSRSYEALSPAAAGLFHRLALYPSREIGSPEAGSLIGVTPRRARLLLAELVSTHLVDEYRPGRYSWPGIVRDYGVELAADLPAVERDQVRRRLFDHYLFNNRQATAIARMKLAAMPPEEPVRPACPGYEAERRMLRKLITQALAEGYGDYVWRFAGVIGDYLDRARLWPELLVAGAGALRAAERRGDLAQNAQILRGLARVHAGLGDYPTAIKLMTVAMPMLVQLEDRKSLAGLHLGSAWLRARAGRPAAGALHADRMLTLVRQAGDPVETASALNAVGWFEARQDRYEAAIAHSRESLRILADLGMRRAQADTWDTLGFVHRRLGQRWESLVSYQRALALHREFGARAAEAATLRCIAQVVPDVPTARQAIDEATDILRELGVPVVPGADRQQQ
jgi:tetratricopeptide (TPR) repeat protein